MSLSSREYNKLIDKINTTFYKLGFAPNMAMPPCDSNTAPVAWKMWVAQHLARMTDKYKEQAEAEAVEAGIIPDKTKKPMPPGKYGGIYHDDNVTITLEVLNYSERVNGKKVVEYLHLAGVDQKLLDEAVRLATPPVTRGAHRFYADLNRDASFGDPPTK